MIRTKLTNVHYLRLFSDKVIGKFDCKIFSNRSKQMLTAVFLFFHHIFVS